MGAGYCSSASLIWQVDDGWHSGPLAVAAGWMGDLSHPALCECDALTGRYRGDH